MRVQSLAKSLLFFVFVFILTFSALADPPVEKLNFKTALGVAFDHNPQMVEARKSIEVSKGDLITARTFKNPEAELEFGGFKKNEEGKRNVNLDSVEIRQPFDPLGVYFLQGKIASGQVKIKEESLRGVWMKVYLDIGQIYSEIILHKKQIELSKQNLESMRQFFLCT